MDAELSQLLTALVDGQIKLAEQGARTERHIEALSKEMRAGFSSLRTEMSEVGKRLDGYGKRLDSYTRAVIRGFTGVTGHHHVQDERIADLDRRVTALEKGRAAPKRRTPRKPRRPS